MRTILRRGADFAFDLDPFGEVHEEAHFDAGGLEIVDQLGFVGGVEFFDRFEFEDDLVFHDDVGHVVAHQLVVVMDLDFLSRAIGDVVL